MKLDRSGQKSLRYLGVQLQRRGYHSPRHSLNRQRKLVRLAFQMLGQYTPIDGLKGVNARKAHGECGEMALKAWIYGKTSRCWVHAGYILNVVDILQCYFHTVIPMLVVHVLANQRVWLNSAVSVHLATDQWQIFSFAPKKNYGISCVYIQRACSCRQ